jgi:hypothetical protein
LLGKDNLADRLISKLKPENKVYSAKAKEVFQAIFDEEKNSIFVLPKSSIVMLLLYTNNKTWLRIFSLPILCNSASKDAGNSTSP